MDDQGHDVVPVGLPIVALPGEEGLFPEETFWLVGAHGKDNGRAAQSVAAGRAYVGSGVSRCSNSSVASASNENPAATAKGAPGPGQGQPGPIRHGEDLGQERDRDQGSDSRDRGKDPLELPLFVIRDRS